MRIFRKLAQMLDVDLTSTPPADGDALTYDSGSSKWMPGAGGGGGGGAPTDADYLVGTANGDLSAEIVVGTSPGGELGGTWATPTVDAVHSGSSHATVQAAAEATAASALSTHSADTTGVHGIADTSSLVLTGDSRLSDSRTPTGAAGGVLGGTYPNPSFAADMATQSELDAHINDTADAHDASAISSVAAGNLSSTDVQAALNELDTEKQPLDSDLTAIAGLSPTDDDVVQRKAGAWTNRTIAQLLTDLAAAGTTFQPLDSDLTSIAALTTTSFGRSLLALADAAALLAAAGAQASDSDLTAIAGLSPTNDDVVQRKAGSWTNRTMAQLIADLAALGTTFQPLDSDLTTIAGLADPNADRLLFWDDSAGAYAYLTAGTNLTITGTTIDASGGGTSPDDVSLIVHMEVFA